MQSLEIIVEPLLFWFDSHKRVLPWRENPTPYRVWVSEIMLQQTRVEAVKPYYERFMEAFPDVDSLAHAREERLLKMWEGLGYYNRVRNMKKAAVCVEQEFDGKMPDSYEKLLELPGIGHYTAGAVASIAFNRPVPAVDGNVLRVISRVSADDSDIMKQTVRTSMEERLKAIMPSKRPGDFNQALMELGAIVCVPNGLPHCEECPWENICEARIQNRISEIPHKSGKAARRIDEKTVFIIRDDEKTALHKRPAKGLLAGMYEFPNVEGHLSAEEALQYVKKKGYSPIRIQEIESSKHIFSHREWHMKAYTIKIEQASDGKDFLFAYSYETEEKYPIPSAFGAYTKYLDIKIGNERFKEEL